MSGVELTDVEKEIILTEVLNANADQVRSIEALANGLAQEHITAHRKQAKNPLSMPVTKEYAAAALAGLLATEKRFAQSHEANGMDRDVDLRQLAGLPKQVPA